ncbi:SRPBCC family protein [Arthrobacter sp. UYCu712]|uniref:SRPBCC family protein n=1 Tax=Arthrobacter sp. UYCu712 TaxID=3156340 RepID=UPI00339466DA
MKSSEAQTLINARNSTVWSIITDASNYTVFASGTTDIQDVTGNGGTIRIQTNSGGRRLNRLRVEQVTGEVLTWTSRLPLGLLTRVRTFKLNPDGEKTHLRVREELSGPLRPLFGNGVRGKGPSFTEYVDAVKVRAETLG